MRSLFILAALCLPSTAALADEVWTSDLGEIVYQADFGDIAQLTVERPGLAPMQIFVPGLGGDFEQRGTYYGYWLAEEAGACPASIVGANDVAATSWGGAIVAFHDPGFPSGLTISLGDCFDTPAVFYVAKPVVG